MAFENGAGVVPVMDINRGGYGYGDGFGCGGGMWFMWIFVIFALMGGGGFGWGNRGVDGALTRNELAAGFDAQDIKNGIRGVQNGLCDGFYAQNTNTLQGFNSVGRDVLESRYQLGSAIAENRFAAQNCCCETQKLIAAVGCETNRSIDAVRAENYKNTCEITNAIHAEGEATRALINANVMQELRDKLADRDRDLMTANFQLSQQAQNARLIEEIRPFPKPSYQTCSPYESARGHYGYGYGGCGCGGYGVAA